LPYAEALSEDEMKISACNQLKGKVTAVKPGATTSHVSIDIGGGNVVMASITNEAVADLGIKVGDEVWAIIKASEVMVGK
jgi:molybdopterin-binding protein